MRPLDETPKDRTWADIKTSMQSSIILAAQSRNSCAEKC